MTPAEAHDPSIITRVAAWMPQITDGEPTKLLVEAWMVHEGKNDNGLVFRAIDLEPAAKRITMPNLLPMDWNHSAVLPQYEWEPQVPKAIGVWYSAEAKVDPAAKNGAGAFGIFVKGVVWAWAFPEQTKEMLAMQEAKGYVPFSMAALTPRVEYGEDAGGRYEMAIEPIFMTLSALNVPGADPDAIGTVTMPLDDSTSGKTAARRVASNQEARNMDKTKEQYEAQISALEAEKTALAEKLASAVAEKAAVDAEVASLKGTVEGLTAKVAAETSRADDASVKMDALKAEFDAMQTAAAAMKSELDAATAQLATIEAEKTKTAQAETFKKRFASLPESYRAAFEKRSEEERGRFEAKWSTAAETEWDEFRKDVMLVVGEPRLSYLKLSRTEGNLPGGWSESAEAHLKSLLKK
jgi:predicted  nucleic acid-binding Zn-ribbon protein